MVKPGTRMGKTARPPPHSLNCSRCQFWGGRGDQEGEAHGGPSVGWSNVAGSEMDRRYPPGVESVRHQRDLFNKKKKKKKGSIWGLEPCPGTPVGGSPGSPWGPFSPALAPAPHHMPSSQTIPTRWVSLAILGKQCACLMTKDFSPVGGVQANENPLGVAGEMSRSCHAT